VRTGGAVQKPDTIPGRGRPNALPAGVAVLAIAAVVALMVWIGALGLGGTETKHVVLAAGARSAVIHDDAGRCTPVWRPGTRRSTTMRATCIVWRGRPSSPTTRATSTAREERGRTQAPSTSRPGRRWSLCGGLRETHRVLMVAEGGVALLAFRGVKGTSDDR
jgi:hypothetical protein